jgi:hypothetical protein
MWRSNNPSMTSKVLVSSTTMPKGKFIQTLATGEKEVHMITEAKAKEPRKPNTTHHDPKDAFEETKREGEYAQGVDRNYKEAKESGPARVQQARQNIHGGSTNTESSFLAPLKKDGTSGGNNK